MKRLFLVVVVLGFALTNVSPALAIKPFQDAFIANYAGDKADAEFKKLVSEAKCNVCHVDKENKKSVRNPYGTTLHDVLEEANFPMADFKKDPAKFADQLKEIFKKIESKESGDEKHKTFADRMAAKLLPGGNVLGKKE